MSLVILLSSTPERSRVKKSTDCRWRWEKTRIRSRSRMRSAIRPVSARRPPFASAWTNTLST